MKQVPFGSWKGEDGALLGRLLGSLPDAGGFLRFELGEGEFEGVDTHGLPAARGSHHHEPVPHADHLVQLDHLPDEDGRRLEVKLLDRHLDGVHAENKQKS